MTTDAQVREFLRRLKSPAPEVMRAVFTRGGCYALSEILQSVFPGAEAWGTTHGSGDMDGEHVVTRIDGKFYDITGQRHLRERGKGDVFTGGIGIMRHILIYERMTPAECRKARKWSPVCWDQVVRK